MSAVSPSLSCVDIGICSKKQRKKFSSIMNGSSGGATMIGSDRRRIVPHIHPIFQKCVHHGLVGELQRVHR